ncbi:hypothetical protein DFJ58DRAFT_182829 [Suillus subalutaceus]|uniref:uncharacterized protein n=1 Tax=Suillus subalutaceus TaxID=48586 RepID=UPI001B86D66E|nr:uncharacterized protein DFJ58DRAFT_182829 [Suillus subalutaceus]KAG1876643.1 hypothetical protein DFJ58DRAFT_182829 [Suillus subalutaceus]
MMDNIDEATKASCLDWSTDFRKQCSALAASDDRILGAEIPGQDQDGYDVEPGFFRGMHGVCAKVYSSGHSLTYCSLQHPHISRPRPQQRPGRFERLSLAVTRSPRSGPPLARARAPRTTLPSAATLTTFKAQLGHLFTWRSDHAAPPVVTVDVPFAQAKERNAAAGAPKPDEDLVPYEYLDDHPPDPDTQQQIPVAGEHGGGCYCC